MNKKRVRFLKSLIYAFIIIVLFLPLILMSFLTLRMISVSQAMQEQLQTLASAISQPVQEPQSSPQEGYVLEPEDQSVNGETPNPQAIDGKNTDSQSPDASGTQPEADGVSSAHLTSDTGDATINNIGNGTLNQLDSGEDNSDTESYSPEDLSPPNYNGNPGTGC